MTSPMQPAADSESRYHALDAVRAFALLLGVVFHAAESFGPDAFRYWAAADNSPSELLGTFRHASHAFRLELFFLIAGFFAHLVWRKRGVQGFVRNRVGRILVPLVVGWCILYPILVFTWVTGAARLGRWEILAIPEQFRSYPPWQLTLGFFMSFEFVKQFDLTHLWFLYQLLVLYALALPLRWACLRLTWLQGALLPWLDARFRAAISSSIKVIWFSALALPALYLQHSWNVDTPKQSLVPELPATFLFAVFFGVGWALHRQPELLGQAGCHWRWHLLIGLLLVMPRCSFAGYFHRLGWLELYRPCVRLWALRAFLADDVVLCIRVSGAFPASPEDRKPSLAICCRLLLLDLFGASAGRGLATNLGGTVAPVLGREVSFHSGGGFPGAFPHLPLFGAIDFHWEAAKRTLLPVPPFVPQLGETERSCRSGRVRVCVSFSREYERPSPWAG